MRQKRGERDHMFQWPTGQQLEPVEFSASYMAVYNWTMKIWWWAMMMFATSSGSCKQNLMEPKKRVLQDNLLCYCNYCGGCIHVDCVLFLRPLLCLNREHTSWSISQTNDQKNYWIIVSASHCNGVDKFTSIMPTVWCCGALEVLRWQQFYIHPTKFPLK